MASLREQLREARRRRKVALRDAKERCRAERIYAHERAMRRTGIPLSHSTMNDLLLAPDLLTPLWRASQEVRCDSHVQADETSYLCDVTVQR